MADPARAATLVIAGPIRRADISALCERATALLLDTDADLLECVLGVLVHADAVAVDALAQLQLTAQRLGCEVRVRRASPELRALIALMGLDDVVLAGR